MVGGHRGGRHRLVAGIVAGASIVASTGGPTIASLDVSPAGVVAAAPSAGATSTSRLVALDPVRLADTREVACGCDRVDDHTIRVDVAGAVDAAVASPAEIAATVVTLTAPPTAAHGFVTVSPGASARPLVSTLNTRPDRVVANSAIVALGDDGTIDVYRHDVGDVVVDLHAVFVHAEHATTGRFVSMPPTRIADTRTPESPSGALPAQGELRLPLPAGVPRDASALVLNVTSVDAPAPGHLSIRPADDRATDTSALNVDGTGAAVAASVIAPVDADGFVIESYSGGHVVVDAAGWFTGPGATDTDIGLFVPVTPERLVDTRESTGRLYAGGAIELPAPADGAAVAVNITAVDADAAGFVTAFAAGTAPPPTSSVNPSFWGHTVANFAIVGASDRGLAFSSLRGTDLVVDAAGWFTGTPSDAIEPPPANVPRPPRTLVVGDSTLVAVSLFPESFAAFRGIDLVYDAMSCRRLWRPSCNSNVTGVTPNTAVEAILTTPGVLDIVVVKTGYNDWFDDLRPDVDAIVRAARSKGAHTVLWLTYNELRHSARGAAAMRENNRQLPEIITRVAYPDVLIADWATYSRDRPDWFWDGIHMSRQGSFALADYVSRWVAALEHRPCPAPWIPGGPVLDPCVPPEWIGPVPAPELL